MCGSLYGYITVSFKVENIQKLTNLVIKVI